MADTYDFYFQSKTNEATIGFKFFTSGFNRTIAVRGLWKLTLQWLRRFMTAKGSDPLRVEEGTEFPNLIGSNIVNAQDIRDVVLLSITDCNEQIYTVQQSTQPPADETLLTAALTKFELLGSDGFEAWVNISNALNEEVAVAIPDFATRTE